MVIAEYTIGGSKIRFHDDCMAKTDEENQAILDRVAKLITSFYQIREGEGRLVTVPASKNQIA